MNPPGLIEFSGAVIWTCPDDECRWCQYSGKDDLDIEMLEYIIELHELLVHGVA